MIPLNQNKDVIFLFKNSKIELIFFLMFIDHHNPSISDKSFYLQQGLIRNFEDHQSMVQLFHRQNKMLWIPNQLAIHGGTNKIFWCDSCWILSTPFSKYLLWYFLEVRDKFFRWRWPNLFSSFLEPLIFFFQTKALKQMSTTNERFIMLTVSSSAHSSNASSGKIVLSIRAWTPII